MLKIGDKVLKINNKWLKGQEDPLNPLNLPPYTIRLRYANGYQPSFSKGTAVQVSSFPNVWDLTYENSNWGSILINNPYLDEVLGANTTDVTDMNQMFRGCISLPSVPLFNTSNVTAMYGMFYDCTSLTTVPLFNTSNVTDIYYMFYYCTSLRTIPLFNTSHVVDMFGMFQNCKNVQSGSLALYQQASSQANPPTNHTATFKNCGSNTTTGSAELAQIPSDWK